MSDLARDLMDLTGILKNGKCEEIERKKCFVVGWGDFLRAYSLTRAFDADSLIDNGLAAAGYNNFEVNISVSDKHRYYVVCKTGPIVDAIWVEPPKKA